MIRVNHPNFKTLLLNHAGQWFFGLPCDPRKDLQAIANVLIGPYDMMAYD